MSAESIDTTAVQGVKVRAVREPLYSNVWSIVDDATGIEIAGLRINDQAGAWANRIADALNAQLAGLPIGSCAQLQRALDHRKAVTMESNFDTSKAVLSAEAIAALQAGPKRHTPEELAAAASEKAALEAAGVVFIDPKAD